MANLMRWFGSWVSAEGHDLQPGQAHHWIMWGFNYGDVLAVTAHPVSRQGGPQRILFVENVRIERLNGDNKLAFSVRNGGTDGIPGYGMGFSIISQ